MLRSGRDFTRQGGADHRIEPSDPGTDRRLQVFEERHLRAISRSDPRGLRHGGGRPDIVRLHRQLVQEQILRRSEGQGGRRLRRAQPGSGEACPRVRRPSGARLVAGQPHALHGRGHPRQYLRAVARAHAGPPLPRDHGRRRLRNGECLPVLPGSRL